MPIPEGKKVVYTGPTHYWGNNKSSSENWNIYPGDKGILIDACKLAREISGKPFHFYPYKWKGFCFDVTESDITDVNDTKYLLQSNAQLTFEL